MMWREVDRLNEVKLEADEGESGRIKIYLKGLFCQTGLQQIALQTNTREVLFLTLVMAALEGSLRLGFFFLTSSSSSKRY